MISIIKGKTRKFLSSLRWFGGKS